jgi:hypothetical protein
MTAEEMRRHLADIDSHMSVVAQSNSAGSGLNEVAYAIHNLVDVLRSLIDQAG